MDSFANGLHCAYDYTQHSFVPVDQQLQSPLSSLPTDQYDPDWASLLSDIPPEGDVAQDVPQERVRRPRNAFMIFRAEFQLDHKLDRTVEHDNRHISRIAGHYWNKLTEEDRDVWRVKAEQEKLAHMRKYPNYKFMPIPRKEKPVKRNVKRNSEAELSRCIRVADLLLEGKEGEELTIAVKNSDVKDVVAPVVEPVVQTEQAPTLPFLPERFPPSGGPLDIFADPSASSEALLRQWKKTFMPDSDALLQRPNQQSSPVQNGSDKYQPLGPLLPASPIYGSSSYDPMSATPRPMAQQGSPIPMLYNVSPTYTVYTATGSYTTSLGVDAIYPESSSYSSYVRSPHHQQSPNYSEPTVNLHSPPEMHHRSFRGLNFSYQPVALGTSYSQDPQLSYQRSPSQATFRNAYHPYANSPAKLSGHPSSSPASSVRDHFPGRSARR